MVCFNCREDLKSDAERVENVATRSCHVCGATGLQGLYAITFAETSKSVPCDIPLCQFCMKEPLSGLVIHENSETCLEIQKHNIGCHACGRMSCHMSANDCHAKCTANLHVCGPGDPDIGCDTCGRVCHQNNSSLRCPFYRKRRGQLSWLTTERDGMRNSFGNFTEP